MYTTLFLVCVSLTISVQIEMLKRERKRFFCPKEMSSGRSLKRLWNDLDHESKTRWIDTGNYHLNSRGDLREMMIGHPIRNKRKKNYLREMMIGHPIRNKRKIIIIYRGDQSKSRYRSNSPTLSNAFVFLWRTCLS